jgi:hypothetical protein
MPRGVYERNTKHTNIVNASDIPPAGDVDALFETMKATLQQKKAEYETALARIDDLLATLDPKPRQGRPPKVTG